MCLGNISKDFTIDNSKKKKTGLKERVNFFPADYRSLNTNEILDIYKHLMKELIFKYFMELMWNNVWIIKKMFIVVSSSIANASNHTKSVSLNNQKSMI